jgi:molybdopterin-biosynthesis enzyme MoeA-like protein
MAFLPDPCDIIWTPGLWVPLVVVENVHVLPGIPLLFQAMLESVRPKLKGTPKERIRIFTQMAEGDFAEMLWQTQQKFPDVAIGSYPKTGDVPYQVMVTLEGRDRIRVQRAAEEVERAIRGHR